MYSKKSISKLLYVALMIEKEQTRIQYMHENWSAIHQALSDPEQYCLSEDAKHAYTPYFGMIMENTFTTANYKKSDLEGFVKMSKDMFASTKNKITELESKDNWSSAPVDLRECLLDYARELINREHRPMADNKRAFIDSALDDYPRSLENAWSNTGNRDAYLFLNMLRTSHPLIYQNMFGDLYNLEVRLGRFCASGTYASLGIELVHQHLHFRINEYDGLEYIS